MLSLSPPSAFMDTVRRASEPLPPLFRLDYESGHCVGRGALLMVNRQAPIGR